MAEGPGNIDPESGSIINLEEEQPWNVPSSTFSENTGVSFKVPQNNDDGMDKTNPPPPLLKEPAVVRPATTVETQKENSNLIPPDPVVSVDIHPPLHRFALRISNISSIGKFVFAMLIIAMLTFIGTVWADDQGIWSTGISHKVSFLKLSSLWNGLSALPSVASTQMDSALKQVDRFSFSGQFKGYSQGSDPVSCGALSGIECLNKIDQLSLSKTFNLKTVQNNLSFSFDATLSSENLKGEYRIVNGDLYESAGVSQTTSSADSPAQASQSSWYKQGKAPLINLGLVNGYLVKKIAQSSFLARENLNGQDVYHFKTSIDGADVPLVASLISDQLASEWQGANGPMDIWVSRKTHLPVRVELFLKQISGQKQQIGLDLIADSNKQVSEISVPEGAVDVNNVVSPDQQRKTDLQKIAAALEQYFKANGVYPVASSVENASSAESALQLKLIPSYIDAIPGDPATGKYYGYTSDGYTYELSAVLDSSSDPEGVNSGSKTMYLVKGSSKVDKTSLQQ